MYTIQMSLAPCDFFSRHSPSPGDVLWLCTARTIISLSSLCKKVCLVVVETLEIDRASQAFRVKGIAANQTPVFLRHRTLGISIQELHCSLVTQKPHFALYFTSEPATSLH